MVVFGGVQDHFGGSVPPGDHVLSQHGVVSVEASRESEVSDFQIAVFIEKEVGRLQISVDDQGRMHIQNSPQDLVNKVLDVFIREFLPRIHNSVHVGLHQVADDVDVFKASPSFVGLDDIKKGDNIFMVKESQQLDFPYDTLRIDEVFKGIVNFLDCDLDSFSSVLGRNYDSISSSSN